MKYLKTKDDLQIFDFHEMFHNFLCSILKFDNYFEDYTPKCNPEFARKKWKILNAYNFLSFAPIRFDCEKVSPSMKSIREQVFL